MKKVIEDPGLKPLVFCRTCHGVGFSRTCLSIGENTDIEACK
jgi:hypothetical protein